MDRPRIIRQLRPADLPPLPEKGSRLRPTPLFWLLLAAGLFYAVLAGVVVAVLR